MASSLRCLIKRVGSQMLRNQSTIAQAAAVVNQPILGFRTTENNPMNHTVDHLGRFYTISPEITNQLFRSGGAPTKFKEHIETLVETAIMVRSPAVEIISCLQRTDYSRPVNRYVLYGKLGVGKSITLMHLLHYGHEAKRVLLHVPWVPEWLKRPKEVAPSATKEGYYDLPINAAEWLVHFKNQNRLLLSELNVTLTKDYTWNQRDQNAAGTPLMGLIDFGIARAKYACEVIEALINEIKINSTAGKINTMVVIDAFNTFLGDFSYARGTDFKFIKPDKITLTQPFIDLIKSDWCNGAIILTVDMLALKKQGVELQNESPYPLYLLGKRGFELLDPFIPIEVQDYSYEEFMTVIDYYKSRMWIRDISEKAIRELELLSNRNPYRLMRLTASL